jgi:competence protein ComFC
MSAIDKARSVFVYKEPINYLIQGLKYSNQRYLIDFFRKDLKNLYLQNYFNADYIIGIPMTKKSLRKRGYNQSILLAKALSEDTGVSYLDCVEKVKESKRQAKLGRAERLKNLKGVFKVINKKLVKDKTIVIVDDVSTTGATAQTVAERLKSAGAKSVYLLTVASVPPRENY